MKKINLIQDKREIIYSRIQGASKTALENISFGDTCNTFIIYLRYFLKLLSNLFSTSII